MARLIVASEVVASGVLTRKQLGRRYVRVYRNVYCPRAERLTAADRVEAAWLNSGRTATMVGISAALLHGSRWISDDTPPELLATHHRAPAGIIAHAGTVRDDETCQRWGMRCTTVERTAYDLGRWLPVDDGVIRVDALLNASSNTVESVRAIAARYPGARNIRRLRTVLELADGGAESPQETRVRLILIRSGLPRPVTQLRVGRRRVDLGWPQWKVGVEYDGVQHWNDPRQRFDDIERREFFADQGWRIVHVLADHLRHPPGIVTRATKALTTAGWRPEASCYPLEAENG